MSLHSLTTHRQIPTQNRIAKLELVILGKEQEEISLNPSTFLNKEEMMTLS